jgi:AraC-like DNA-binding protein
MIVARNEMTPAQAVGKRRRRVDWPLIGVDIPAPRVVNRPVPVSLAGLLATFDEIRALDDPDAILRRAVELARDRIGLCRVSIFLLDRSRDLMLGSWGSDLQSQLADEHHVMYAVTDTEREAFRRAREDGAPFTVFDGCPLIEHRDSRTRIGGRGWVACTPIRSAHAMIGMLFNDAGLSQAQVDGAKQAHVAILCGLLGALLDPVRSAPGLAVAAPSESSRRGLAAAAAALLGKDPALGGKDLALRLAVSPGRLTRAFKIEMGISLVAYRNRLRVDRFTALLRTGRRNLLEAALEAGFGSYAQFHRVFRAIRHVTPRDYRRRV